MQIEIKSHTWKERGENHGADCFPFIDGKPRHDIDCQNCEHFREGAEWCQGWIDDQDNAPMFCGPICPKFELSENK
jgi:hypothetical protein